MTFDEYWETVRDVHSSGLDFSKAAWDFQQKKIDEDCISVANEFREYQIKINKLEERLDIAIEALEIDDCESNHSEENLNDIDALLNDGYCSGCESRVEIGYLDPAQEALEKIT